MKSKYYSSILLILSANAQALSLNPLGSYHINSALTYQNIPFGGISGLEHIEDTRFIALSDERGGGKTGAPRYYHLNIAHNEQGILHINIDGQFPLKTENNQNFSADNASVDPEAIRKAPNGNYYWSSEGNWHLLAANRHQPFVREMTADGAFVREFTLPDGFNYVDNQTTGARNNLSFEALSLSPDAQVLTVATENALLQDGEISNFAQGAWLRFTQFSTENGALLGQYAYPLPALSLSPNTASDGASNGLTELLSLDDNQWLGLERSYTKGVGNKVEIVRIKKSAQTTDVTNITHLNQVNFQALEREVLLSMVVNYQGKRVDNLEAMAWGKPLANGNRTLLVASDNNFNAKQETQFWLFEVQE